ncbi:RNA binding motif protein [Salix suchowensis]|nr:RNA binding motif protein [Salix suchowensis]
MDIDPDRIEINSLRLPMKFGNHRGFAFVEHVTKQETQNALLSSTSPICMVDTWFWREQMKVRAWKNYGLAWLLNLPRSNMVSRNQPTKLSKRGRTSQTWTRKA